MKKIPEPFEQLHIYGYCNAEIVPRTHKKAATHSSLKAFVPNTIRPVIPFLGPVNLLKYPKT